MGNSSSNSSRMSKKSESMEIRSNKSGRSSNEFCKSKSMMDMSTKTNTTSSRMSTSSSTSRQKSITSIKDKDRPKSAKTNEVSRQKSIKREAPHPITLQGRDIISQCFENPHSEFANKVVQRIFEKREDYQKFILNLGKERSYLVNLRLKMLIEDIVAHIHESEFIENISKQYGEEHVELKQYGFKPDFWVAVADAMTLEGVILDMANHQPADTVSAWSSLVTMIFSSVRDGYYSELRRHRMSSRRTLKHQSTVESKEEAEAEPSAPPTLGKEQSRVNLSTTVEEVTQPIVQKNILATTNVNNTTITTNKSMPARTMSSYASESSLHHSKKNGHVTSSSSTAVSNGPVRRPIFE
ncbi:unnamed protein product [Caenorhabditis angaria]|uniref:Globin family profile domain-containing protein n=1 Tax=Caenorhabditis angaria TaxID=860376 RepID=A0A9P1NB28_9PELO|nr:unnamed protein product [Caenorhabditis angaria]